MQETGRINVTELVDQSKVGPFHILLFALCALSLVMDGFDVQVIGFLGPELVDQFQLADGVIGNVVGVGNLGLMIGALLFTVIGDRLGRRPVLIVGTMFYGLISLLTAQAETLTQLYVLRFIGGLGLGAVVPNATALIGEYSPKHLRVILMMAITVGFTVGAAFGGLLSNQLVPAFGWQSVFYFGGIVPLVIGVLMIFWLPESLQFLMNRRKFDHVAKWIRRVHPEVSTSADTEYVAHEVVRKGVPVLNLLLDGRAGVTLLYWIVNFTNLVNLYFLAGLLPTILTNYGFEPNSARFVGYMMQFGGVVGTFGFAWLIAKRGFTTILMSGFVVATLTIALAGTGPVLSSLTGLTIVMFIVGWCIVGGQPGLNSMAATYYPTEMRSTGIGWGLGWGRMGGFAGPVIGAQLMALGWGAQSLLLALAVPAVASAIAMLALHLLLKPAAGETALGQTAA